MAVPVVTVTRFAKYRPVLTFVDRLMALHFMQIGVQPAARRK
jgi:hypothetical protein